MLNQSIDTKTYVLVGKLLNGNEKINKIGTTLFVTIYTITNFQDVNVNSFEINVPKKVNLEIFCNLCIFPATWGIV